MISNIKHLLKP